MGISYRHFFGEATSSLILLYLLLFIIEKIKTGAVSLYFNAEDLIWLIFLSGLCYLFALIFEPKTKDDFKLLLKKLNKKDQNRQG